MYTHAGCGAACEPGWLNDHVCDDACNTAACLFDAGDCGGVGPGVAIFSVHK